MTGLSSYVPRYCCVGLECQNINQIFAASAFDLFWTSGTHPCLLIDVVRCIDTSFSWLHTCVWKARSAVRSLYSCHQPNPHKPRYFRSSSDCWHCECASLNRNSNRKHVPISSPSLCLCPQRSWCTQSLNRPCIADEMSVKLDHKHYLANLSLV